MIEQTLKKEFCYLRDRIIEKRYQHLDPIQRKAVLSSSNNCVIVACPGAGKTVVIINRVDYLCTFGPIYNTDYVPNSLKPEDLEVMREYLNNNMPVKNIVIINRTAHLIKDRGVDADNIVILTFTKVAALNMKQRYLRLTNSKKTPFFGTFHGLFYKILSRHLGKLNIIKSSDAYKLIKGVLVTYLDSVSDEKIKEVLNDISLLKNSEENIENFTPKIDKSIFKNCLGLYEGFKKENNLMDFDDLQLNSKQLFIRRPLFLQGYRKLFKYMLVDEFQDSDKLQIQLLQMLTVGNSVFAVGDEDQCIYGFRGSRPDCMVDFNKYFENGKKIFLRVNYRSVENIVNLSKKVIENNKNRNIKEINWNNNQIGNINFFSMDNEKEQSKKIAEIIDQLVKDKSYRYKDVAILYRTNMESRSVIDIFLKKDIPFKLLDRKYDFFDHFVCKDILAYLKLSIDITDKESFNRIINRPFRYVSRVNVEKVRRNIIKESCFLSLREVDDIPIFQIKSIEKLENDILRLDKMYLKDAINFIIKDLGYMDYLYDYSQRSKIDIEEFKDVVEEFKESAEDFLRITSFLVHVSEIKEQLSEKSNDESGVILSTIHHIKGMEFKNVCIINCNEGVIPHINSLPKNLEEERRLFYVGITRAIDNLNIFTTKKLKGKAQEASRFINECGVTFDSSQDENKLKELYKIGDYITHKTFGRGKISSLDGKYISIIFSNNVERKFDAFVLKNSELVIKD